MVVAGWFFVKREALNGLYPRGRISIFGLVGTMFIRQRGGKAISKCLFVEESSRLNIPYQVLGVMGKISDFRVFYR
jgi:hypothetical protein